MAGYPLLFEICPASVDIFIEVCLCSEKQGVIHSYSLVTAGSQPFLKYIAITQPVAMPQGVGLQLLFPE